MPEDHATDVSRHVTVFRQLEETDSKGEDERYIAHGKHTNDRYKFDREQEDFVPVARPIAVIDTGVEMPSANLETWCNSHAGKAVLSQFFADIEPADLSLLDAQN